MAQFGPDHSRDNDARSEDGASTAYETLQENYYAQVFSQLHFSPSRIRANDFSDQHIAY